MSPSSSSLARPGSATPTNHADDESLVPVPHANPSPEEPYTIFQSRYRVWVLSIVVLSAFVSPISVNIYQAAIPTAARDLLTSVESISLSITAFMVSQGISPLFFGSATDHTGRRPIYIVCLTIYVGVTAGLYRLPKATEGNKHAVYAGLIILRVVQAAGSASMVSIGAGTVADMTLPSNRAGIMSVLNATLALGPALGPLIGSAIVSRFNWRVVFLVVLIYAAVCLTLLILFLPESLRSLVGNGSKPPPTVFHEAVWRLVTHTTSSQVTGTPRPGFPRKQRTYPPGTTRWQRTGMLWRERVATVLKPLLYMRHPEVLLVLIGNATPFATYYMVIQPISVVFQNRYHYSVMSTGLVFLACGVGNAFASVTTGRMLDVIYRRRARRFDEEEQARRTGVPVQHGMASRLRSIPRTLSGRGGVPAPRADTEVQEKSPRVYHSGIASSLGHMEEPAEEKDGLRHESSHPRTSIDVVRAELACAPLRKGEMHPIFPLEEARVRVLYIAIPLMCLSQIALGWCIEARVHASGPIVLVVLVGMAIAQFMSVTSTMLVDDLPAAGAGITACNNLWRCCLGAVAAAVVQYIYDGIGPGWCYTLVAGMTALCMPCFALVLLRGPHWRRQRWLRARQDGAAVEDAALSSPPLR